MKNSRSRKTNAPVRPPAPKPDSNRDEKSGEDADKIVETKTDNFGDIQDKQEVETDKDNKNE